MQAVGSAGAEARQRQRHSRRHWWLTAVALVSALALLAAACSSGDDSGGGSVGGSSDKIIKDRKLSDADVKAALMTYTPSGQKDPYIMFASGGHAGQVFVVGMPSMRILRTIALFTPEPWEGYGYGSVSQEQMLSEGDFKDNKIRWGDAHHPPLAETAGDYNGEALFINDKANARLGVIDLRDFEAKQIIKNPIAMVDHGGTFVTPNTEYVIEGGQYAHPLGWQYAPLDQYKDKYRGMVTLWKYDKATRRINKDESFAIELPPYWQDLCDAGKKDSMGWFFCNSFNTEMATGGIESGKDPFEAGVSANDTDYLHVMNWQKAEEVFKAGKTEDVNGMKVISLDTATKEGLVYLIPEPKSPHGADVTPDGKYVVVSGKLDPHVTIYSWDKINKAIEAGTTEKDDFGVPILDFDKTMEAQVELGLGPLHTQFDDKGYAYTSLFLDSAVARWSLANPPAGDKPWSLITKTSVQYNIGHLAAAEGDTVSPDGQWLVALNKWSLDRFFTTGPLLPQNFQLLDISQTGKNMPVLYDMPMGIGEPHYAQIIKADKLKPFEIYPEIGYDPSTMAVDPKAPKSEKDARIERNGNNVEIFQTLIRSHYNPEHVEINKGDHVTWHLTNLESTLDATHGFALPGYNVTLSLEAGETETIEFDANESGVFPFYCTEFCSALHLEMMGYFLVKG